MLTTSKKIREIGRLKMGKIGYENEKINFKVPRPKQQKLENTK